MSLTFFCMLFIYETIAEIKLASQEVKAKEIKMDEMFRQQAFYITTIYKYINEERFNFDSNCEYQMP